MTDKDRETVRALFKDKGIDAVWKKRTENFVEVIKKIRILKDGNPERKDVYDTAYRVAFSYPNYFFIVNTVDQAVEKIVSRIYQDLMFKKRKEDSECQQD